MFESIDPFKNELIETYEEDSVVLISSKLDNAQKCFAVWRSTSFLERSEILRNLSKALRDKNEELANLATREMGKPLSQAKAEVEKCAWLCNHYAENTETYLKPVKIETDAQKSWAAFEPLGAILGIMPWNFPYWQVIRFAVPTIMAGNTVLVKHASNVQGCAKALQELFESSGFPDGTYQNLAVKSHKVDEIIANPIIKGVSLTGSEKAGSAVSKTAGELIKKSLLELGGSNTFIVLKDADLEKSADLCITARMQNNGQSCIAAKRIILEAEIAEEFKGLLLNRVKNLKVGDPMDGDTNVGPLARIDLADELEDQMKRSIIMGAKLIFGGNRDKALFYPTLLDNVRPGTPAFDEETFGPLLSLTIARNANHAVELSNKSRFGLGVTICSSDIDRALELAKDIEDGAVFINEMVKSDPRLPFGGTKISGFGRELGEFGIKEFTNTKTYYVK